MAVIYDRFTRELAGAPGKKNLEHLIARTVPVQMKLSEEAANAARRARAELARHRHDGDAEILVEKGRIDRYVILSDERGLKAAMSIEYGRKASTTNPRGPMPGLFILHNAFQIRRPRG